jgi:nucleoside-diphosphate-sugar epimerase
MLITGDAGFVGISIAEALVESGSSVVVLDVNPYPEHKISLPLDRPISA